MNTSQEKLIAHLSAEITAWTAYLATYRSRVAFAVLVGPFVLLGSFVVATKGVGVIPLNARTWTAAAIASLCYLAAGVYGAMLDSHITDQCDRWRQQIVRLSRGEALQEDQVVFEHYSVRAYVMGIVLFLGASVAIAFALFVR